MLANGFWHGTSVMWFASKLAPTQEPSERFVPHSLSVSAWTTGAWVYLRKENDLPAETVSYLGETREITYLA
ncbi:hypothetical protein D0N87_07670 [Pseudomonas sp. ATCC 13867]|nr:hypothetical protein D0N87_07670 [Pseudomonas sp. ATCC 13867]